MRHAFTLPLVGLAVASAIPDVSSTLQNILKNTDGTNKYRYPTDFTRGILPVSSYRWMMMVTVEVDFRSRNLSTATTTTGETFPSTQDYPMVPFLLRQMSG
jgi:hypothetical protein